MSIPNIISAETLASKIDALAADCQKWESGAYRTSNEQLYDLLNQCLELLYQMKGQRKIIRELNNILENRGIRTKIHTSLATKVVRLVFGECGPRGYTYSRVITAAYHGKAENVSLKKFIELAGGIEAIRVSQKRQVLTVAQQEAAHRAQAERDLLAAPGLVSFPELAELLPSDEAEHDLIVAVVRRNGDGTSSIVHGTQNKRIINLALADAGKTRSAKQVAAFVAKDAVIGPAILRKSGR